MPERIMPGLGLQAFYDPGQTGWGTPVSEDLRRLSALVQAGVISRSTTLPGTGDPGDIYLVPPGAASHANALALWDGPTGAEDWVFLTPQPGWRVFVADEGSFAWFNGAAWVAEAATTLAGLTDTDVATAPPGDGDTLVWDAGAEKWVPGPPLITSKCLVTLPSAQAITANTWTRINFSTVFFDVGGDFNAGSTHRFTAPAAGHYLAVIGFVHQDTAGTPTLMRGGFGLNGANPANYARSSVANPVSLASQLEFTTLLSLAAGDTVAGMVYFQGTGASIPGPNLARMSIARMP